MDTPGESELVEVADGVFAYLQADGTWGWSNAGLVAGTNESVLIDTLFDLALTQRMLDSMRPHTNSRPIRSVVNTHANGDHCYGNQLLAAPDVDIIASAAAAKEMEEVPAELLASMVAGITEGELGSYIQHAFGAFDFNGIQHIEPTLLFDQQHTVDAGDRAVELFEVGPAHTDGDVIAWLPDEGVLFSGDILFVEGTPIMWAGPVDGWIAALDRILELEPKVIVPGHGPLTDAAGVRSLRSYFEDLKRWVTERHVAGLSLEDTIRDIDAEVDRSAYAAWTDRERIVVNVQSVWRELDTSFVSPDVLAVFSSMAQNHAERVEQERVSN